MRKTLSFLFVSIVVCMNSFSQNVPDWENPEVFAVNKENTRTTALPYPSEQLAIGDDYDASPYYQSLNGKWKIHWVHK